MPAASETYAACTPKDELKGVVENWSYGMNPNDRWSALAFLGLGCLLVGAVGYVYEKNTTGGKKR